MDRSVLVYDGDTAGIGAVAGALTRLADGIVAVPWGCESVGAFLDAQFGGRPFAFVLIEGDAVHVGGAAVERLLRGRLPGPVAGLARRLYDVVGGPFGRVVHGRRPADIDGTFPLAAGARPHAESLRRDCAVAGDRG